MKEKDRSTLKKFFETGDRPTEENFAQLIDSFVNKADDQISVESNNVGIGTENPTARLEVNGDIKSSGGLMVGANLTVNGEMEVLGKMTTRNVEYHEGDVQLGDEITDKVSIYGTLQGKKENTALEIISPVNMAKSLVTKGDIETEGNLTVHGDTVLGAEGVDQIPVVTINSLVQSGRDALVIKSIGNASASYGLKVQNSDGIDQLAVRSDGNVGIGTINPDEKLDVNGNLKATAFIGDGANLTNLNASEMSAGVIDAIHIPGTIHINTVNAKTVGGLKLYDTGNQGIFIQEGGQIGVGTDEPTAKVHIYDLHLNTLDSPENLKDASKYHLMIQGSATLNKGSGIAFGSASKVGASILHIERGSGSKGDLAFYTKQSTDDVAPVEAMRIESRGNVGIGTIDPDERLEVNGNIKADAFIGNGAEVTGLDASKISTGTLDAARLPDIDSSKITSGTINTDRIPDLDASKITTGIISADRLPPIDASSITGDPLSNDMLPNDIAASEIKALDSNGLKLSDQSSRGIFIQNGGNIGIGEENPGQLLHLKGNIDGLAGLRLTRSGIANSDVDLLTGAGGDGKEFRALVGGAEALRIKVNGNVGIGEENPASKLHVGGIITAQGFQMEDGSEITGSGGSGEELPIQEVYVINTAGNKVIVEDYSTIKVEDLAQGITIVFDENANISPDVGKRYCRVTVDKPGFFRPGGHSHLSQGDKTIGRSPFMLEAILSFSNNTIQISLTDQDFENLSTKLLMDSHIHLNLIGRHMEAGQNRKFEDTQITLQLESKIKILDYIGEYGRGDGQFEWSPGIAIDGDKNVYVIDYNQHRIQKFNSEGSFLLKWGSQGSEDGQLLYPYGIDVDSEGKVYVSDSHNHRIQVFDREGNFLLKWGSQGSSDGQFNYPRDVAVDGDGVFVSDSNNYRIQIFSTDGTYKGQFGSQGTEDGQFNYVQHLSARNGRIYAADSNNRRIQVFKSNGEFILKFGQLGQNEGDFNYPRGVAADGEGNIYVADSNNYRISQFTSEGEYIMSWGTNGNDFGQFYSLQDVEIAPDGTVYALDHRNIVSFKIT